MAMEKRQPINAELKQEVLLHVNQRLFQQGIIGQEIYEQAKVKIVSSTT